MYRREPDRRLNSVIQFHDSSRVAGIKRLATPGFSPDICLQMVLVYFLVYFTAAEPSHCTDVSHTASRVVPPLANLSANNSLSQTRLLFPRKILSTCIVTEARSSFLLKSVGDSIWMLVILHVRRRYRSDIETYPLHNMCCLRAVGLSLRSVIDFIRNHQHAILTRRGKARQIWILHTMKLLQRGRLCNHPEQPFYSSCLRFHGAYSLPCRALVLVWFFDACPGPVYVYLIYVYLIYR
jgi:hypothetical protein